MIRGRNLTELGSAERSLLRRMVTAREDNDAIEILPEHREAEKCIDVSAEYGYLIFRSLSQRLGCDDYIPEAAGAKAADEGTAEAAT